MARARFTLLLLAAGCSRTFSAPASQPLQADPAFLSVAPQQALVLKAEGGRGESTYVWSWIEGGQLSGADATLDATGHYRAGSQGSAQDVVQVSDGTSTVQVHLAVGQRLTLAPAAVSLAPDAGLTFLAAGGKPPYQFSFGAAQCPERSEPTSAPGRTIDSSSGAYHAGSTADSLDCVVVTDATADESGPHAFAATPVAVGHSLAVYPASIDTPVAPTSTIDFVALGGQPPYTFAITTDGGSTIDPVLGHFTASAKGGAPDTVQVSDAVGSSVQVVVPIGPALSASFLSPASPLPGVSQELGASGGRPPYSFGFAPHGNRTNGTVVPSSSGGALYTPGMNAGASDILRVSDATGVAFVDLPVPPNGPRYVAAGPGTHAAVGDFDGDGMTDLVIGDTSNLLIPSNRRLDLVLAPGTDSPQLTSYDRGGTLLDFLVDDLDGDGLSDLVLFRGDGIDVAYGTFSGALEPPVRVMDSYVRGAVPQVTTAHDATGAVHLAFGGLPDAGGLCAPTGINTPEMVDAVYPPFSRTPIFSCRPGSKTMVGMAAGDFFFDGGTEVAWVDDGGVHVDPVPFVDDGGFQLDVQLDAGDVSQTSTVFSTSTTVLALRGRGAGPDQLLVRLSAGGVQTAQSVTLAPVPTLSAPFVLPFTRAVEGMAARATLAGQPDDRVLAWDSSGGSVLQLCVDPSGTLSRDVDVPPVAFQVEAVASGDFDGDGLSDVAELTDTQVVQTDLQWGSGTLGFAQQLHFERHGTLLQSDIDGDGLDDFIDLAEDGTAQVLFGGDGQLAYGPTYRTPKPTLGGILEHLLPDGGLAFLAAYNEGGFAMFAVQPDGHITPAGPGFGSVVGGADSAVHEVDGTPMLESVNTMNRAYFGGALPVDAFTSEVVLPSDGGFQSTIGSAIVFGPDGYATRYPAPPLPSNGIACKLAAPRSSPGGGSYLVAACRTNGRALIGFYRTSFDGGVFDDWADAGTVESSIVTPGGFVFDTLNLRSIADGERAYFTVNSVSTSDTRIDAAPPQVVRVGLNDFTVFTLPDGGAPGVAGMRLADPDGGPDKLLVHMAGPTLMVQPLDDGGIEVLTAIEDRGAPTKLAVLTDGGPPSMIFNENGLKELVIHPLGVDGGYQ
ncbi:MAG: FG-GAP repeat protein [Deltaproteobacteria bacterium]|nr:FG-GAP repeat protein [Deltaproteobacteria bacterium]